MKIREKVNRYGWCAQSLEGLERELERFVPEGFRIPEEPGGWWHEYVCPEHHAELLFDPMAADADTFRCPYGCELQGEPYRGGWLVFKHQSLARYALQAAAVYAGTGKAAYAELAQNILAQYARQYPRYPIHPEAQVWMLKGRAFHQALSEAIWASVLIRASLLLRDEGIAWAEASEEAAAWQIFLTMMETSMTQYRHVLIHERGTPESNYTAWLNAALACVYAAWNDPGRLRTLIEGDGGFVDHLSIGVKPDQFEYEGSTYYHLFVMRAYLITAEMAQRFDLDLYGVQGREGQSLEGMFEVLVDLANDRGELPALHDGPYKREAYAREIAEVMESGYAQYPNGGKYVPILAEAYRQLYGAAGRGGLEAVAFGVGDWSATGSGTFSEAWPSRKSRLMEPSGLALLRHPGNPLSALVDFGPHGGSHGHYDKLHLTVDHRAGAVTPELGMVPYGSPLRKAWYAATASHNTVSVGGRSQAEHTGTCMKFVSSEIHAYVWTRSLGAYERCVLDRHLLLTKDWLLDWFEVKLEKEQEMDWWLHHLGEAGDPLAEGWALYAESLGEADGYGMARAHSRWNGSQGSYSLRIPLGTSGESGHVDVSGLLSKTSSVIQFDYPGTADDPSQRSAGLLHRQTGHSASFVHLYADGGSAPAEMRWAARTGAADSTRGLEIRDRGYVWTVTLAELDGLQILDGRDA